jgi:hypothetical protein
LSQRLFQARHLLVPRESDAMEIARNLKIDSVGDGTDFGKRIRLHADEVLRDAREPLHGNPLGRLLSRNKRIQEGWIRQGNWQGLVAALLTHGAILRMRGELDQNCWDRDVRAARNLALGVEHLIKGYGRRHFPDFVTLFSTENGFQRVRLALDVREPDVARAELKRLQPLLDKLGQERILADFLRDEAECVIYKNRLKRPSPTERQRAEDLLCEAEAIHQKLPESPYWWLGLWYQKMQLFGDQGRWPEFDELAAKYAAICRQIPHLYHYRRLVRLCDGRFSEAYRCQPAYIAAGIASVYRDDRFVVL